MRGRGSGSISRCELVELAVVEKEWRLLIASRRLSPLLDLSGGRDWASVSALCAAVAAVTMTLIESSTTEESASLSDIVRLLLSVLVAVRLSSLAVGEWDRSDGYVCMENGAWF